MIDSTFAFSKDRGKSWTLGDTGFEKPDLFCIDFVGAFGLAAGSGGHVIKTSDGGATWREVEPGWHLPAQLTFRRTLGPDFGPETFEWSQVELR